MIQDEMQKEALRILRSNPQAPGVKLTPAQASDEIVTLFCMLHGGIEEAMPIVRTQFFRSYVDFDNPTKKGIHKVAEGLIGVTEFLKGKEIAELTRKRFQFFLRNTDDN